MARTGALVHDPDALYEGEQDPLTLDPWANVRQPLALQADVRHFFSPSDALFGLRYNPLTRAPLVGGIGDYDPIVHRDTLYSDYLNLLRDLRQRGWAHPERVAADMCALYAATADEQAPEDHSPLLWQYMRRRGLAPELFAQEVFHTAGGGHHRYHPRAR